MNSEQGIFINDLSSYHLDSVTDLMRSRGIIKDDETPLHVFNRVAGSLLSADTKLNNGNFDKDFANNVIGLIEDKTLVFGTPVLTNAGRDGLTTAACTVVPLETRNGLLDLEQFRIQSSEQLSDAIGTGYDLSELKQPVPELLKMNDVLNVLNTQLINSKKRPVASMATLRADHPQILDFIKAKRDVDFNSWRFNISVFVTEELFQLAEKDEMWELKEYDPEIQQDVVVDSVPAKQLLYDIANNAHYCGEPGVLFKDRFQKDNPTPQWEYKSTAPCAEVAMAPGEVCQFSYVNLTDLIEDKNGDSHFDFDKLEKAVRVMTRLLDASVQITIDNDSFTREKIAAKRRIGIGITGFAGMLVNLNIPYESSDAELLASQISELIDFSSKAESVHLATERGAFPELLNSRYIDKEWIRRKSSSETGIVSKEEWDILYSNIEKYGLRNASTTAYPPTGTSSRIASTTTSFEPAYELAVWDLDTSAEKPNVFVPNFYDFVHSSLDKKLDAETKENAIYEIQKNNFIAPEHVLDRIGRTYATAKQIPHSAHLNIQAAFQKFADESGAKTINLSNSSSVEDVLSVFEAAHRLGLKGLTVFRDNCLNERNLSYE